MKGIYLISETACLNPHSGANKHINAGFNEMNKQFKMELLMFCKPYTQLKEGKSKSLYKKKFKSNKIKSFIKWFYILFINHISFFFFLKKVKKIQPQFIYERPSYLNYNGIIISKLLRIPHFYEVNGILSKSNSRYYPWVCNEISYSLERFAYKNTFGFYIGGINIELGIQNNAVIIQNGIEREFVKLFSLRNNEIKDKINVAFIGHAMVHHKLEVLVEALSYLKNPEKFKLHLIGSNLDNLLSFIPPQVETAYYGSLNHEQIAAVIKTFNIGIITHALPFFSHVKAFMYGAAKLTLLLPNSRNFLSIFSSDEVVFFENGTAKDLANKLNELESEPEIMGGYGEKVYKKISNDFTWDKIYFEISSIIKDKLSSHI